MSLDGEAERSAQDAESHGKLPEPADHAAIVEVVRRGLEEMKAGLGRPAAEVLDDIRGEFAITPES